MSESDTLDYESAIKYFTNMFPSIDQSTIEKVLHEKNGGIEESLEKLLEIASEAPPSYEEVTRQQPRLDRKQPARINVNNVNTKQNQPRPQKPQLPSFVLEAERQKQTNLFTNQRQLEDDELLARQLQRSEIFQFERSRSTPLPQQTQRSRPSRRSRECSDQSPTHVVIPPMNDLEPDSTNSDSVFMEESNNFGGLPQQSRMNSDHNANSWLSSETPRSSTNPLGNNIKKAKASITDWYRSKFKSRRGFSDTQKGDTNFGYRLSDS